MPTSRRRLSAGVAVILGLWTAGSGCNNFPVASLASEGRAPVVRAAADAPVPVASTGAFVRVSTPTGLQVRSQLRWTVETAEPIGSMSGQAVVGPDGTVVLGPYGIFQVAGLTVEQAQAQIERQLGAYARGARVRLTSAETAVTAEWRAAGTSHPSPVRPAGGPDMSGPDWKAPPLQPSLQAAPVVQPVQQPAPPVTVQAVPLMQFAEQRAPRTALSHPTTKPLRSGWRPVQRVSAPVPPRTPPGTQAVRAPAPTAVPQASRLMQRTGGPEGAPPPHSVHGPLPGEMVAHGVPVADGHAPDVHSPAGLGHGPAPTEQQRISLPPYLIGPPDILQIDSLQGLLTQPVRGPHLVRPDGTVSIGAYGSVYVTGMTIDQARIEIGRVIHSRLDPTKQGLKDVLDGLSVDVLAYNSKVYYVITDRLGLGEIVQRLPITGSETVLDAISALNGLPPEASKRKIWVARKTPGHSGGNNILPVDWVGITQRGEMRTNYQLMPGDRVYVRAETVQKADFFLAKVLSPIQRLFGITLLGSETVNSIRGRQQ
ncbi:MAG: polysaccharide biosynthesis/export family protein [Gemmataceae bacterium]|nr:polysaccharide biosynthesis/export family protein [Gemmataceae bacterium]